MYVHFSTQCLKNWTNKSQWQLQHVILSELQSAALKISLATSKRGATYNRRFLESVLLSYITEANSNRTGARQTALSLWAQSFDFQTSPWKLTHSSALLKFPACIPGCEKDYFRFMQWWYLEAPAETRAALCKAWSKHTAEGCALEQSGREAETRGSEAVCSRSHNTSLTGQSLLIHCESTELKIPNTR